MRIESIVLYAIMYSSTIAQQRKAFVNPQSQCRIKCLNGGFCAYLVDNPSVHTCLCLLNLFHGDRCQYAVLDTTTVAPTTAEHFLRRHSEGRLEKYLQQHKKQISEPEKLPDDQAITYDSSPTNYAEVYQLKESAVRVNAPNKNINKEEEDYTESWEDGDEEYVYDDDSSPSGALKTKTKIPVWLQNSDELIKVDTVQQEHPHRIYSSRKNKDEMAMNIDKDGRVRSNEEVLVQRTSESSNLRSQELIPESESEDEGWMMSKRRRVIMNGTNKPLQSTFLSIFLVMQLVR